MSVPLAIGAAVIDSAMYDVPGGYRAVMFDRFKGVLPKVSATCYGGPPTILVTFVC